jgi:hypothetical protein
MSITSFRLAREAQEVMSKQVSEVSPAEEASPMPNPVEDEKIQPEEAAAPPSSGIATVKPKPKTTTQK